MQALPWSAPSIPVVAMFAVVDCLNQQPRFQRKCIAGAARRSSPIGGIHAHSRSPDNIGSV